MPKQTNNGLPAGVSIVGNRPGLYRLTCMVHGKRYSEYYRPTETGKKKLQSELQKAIDAFREKVERGTLSNGNINDKSTFSQAVKWFLEMRKLNIRESTQLADKFIFEHYLVPRLGNYALKEITSPIITKLLAELLEKGGGGGRAKYAAKPRIGEKDTPAYLDNINIPIFLEALGELDIDNSTRVALTLMLMLGLRSGEARGLRWIDIDFNNNIVSIEKNAGDTFNGLALTDLKTKRSRRKLPLFPVLRNILLNHKKLLDERKRALGSAWKDNGLVCPNLTGGLMDKSTPNKAVKRILNARKELPCGLHAHSLRHSFVSLLISNGLDVVNVASLAGDTIEIISKHYAHSFAERCAAAMDIVGNSFAQFGNNTNYLSLSQ